MVGHAVAVSAPGKVLLAGGYLVLDPKYTGLVFGLSARIHVTIQPIATSNGVTLNEIVVQSPQFKNAVWEYGYRLAERDGGIEIVQLRVDADLNLNRNPFVETTLAYALSYIASTSYPQISPARITILADNDYYSTPADIGDGSGTSLRFHDFAVPISKAHKTGLGSSAALVTALTAALLRYYMPSFDLRDDLHQRKLHNLAQAAHCAAQGKVGSGFDVASAVYGSCIYQRFSPSILANHDEPGNAQFGRQLQSIVDETGITWDYQILRRAVFVPPGVRLVMCDVNCGSSTPGMVKQVLSWRKQKPDEANAIWEQLAEANRDLSEELKRAALSTGAATDGEYAAVRGCLQRIRKFIRLMSQKSGVPIEPPEQTALLDACERVDGVVGGVVPGAGGYDAISLLVRDDKRTMSKVKELMASWKFSAGANDDPSGGRVSILGVREEMEGIRWEEPSQYEAWLG